MPPETDRSVEARESGDVFFLYRPVVEEHDPEGFGEVQNFHMVLAPRGGKQARLAVIGRKRLPDVDDHERNWGFVEAIMEPENLEEELREQTYQTQTRGERTAPAARPAGEGAYEFIEVDGALHLVYALRFPEEPGPVQQELNIAPEAAFVVSIKNPDVDSPPGVGLPPEKRADYPGELQEVFRGRRFADDPRLLDFEGAEFILIGARTDPEEEYGVEIEEEASRRETSAAFERMRLAKSRHPVEPLFKGEWD